VKELLLRWEGRQLQGKSVIRTLHSDSSGFGWAGVDLKTGQKVHEFWRSEAGLHINIKELRAAISTVKTLAQPGEKVFLTVDNSVTWSYLRKSGGRKPHLNAICRPFLQWCWDNKIELQPNLVASEDMVADELSRLPVDPGDYTLKREIFQEILKVFRPHVKPEVDMFSSPGNSQITKFVSRWPHWQAWGCNALEMDLAPVEHCWANPPWKLILPWLERLRENPHINCLLAVPWWVGSVWWPLLVRLHRRGTPVVLVKPRWGLFTNCLGQEMPPTRWPLVCLTLSGSCWRENKFHLKVSNFI